MMKELTNIWSTKIIMLAKGIIGFTLFVVLTSCKPEPVPAEPDPLTDGKPRLISISFPGIPKGDVVIDQKNFLVTVKVPSTVSNEIVPEISLTDNAAVFGGMEFLLETYNGGIGLLMGDSVMFRLVDKNNPKFGEAATTYFFKAIPSGPLRIINNQPNAIEHVLMTIESPDTWFSFENLYGNKLPKSYQLLNKQTGETFTQVGWMLKGSGNRVNQLGIELDRIRGLIPGSYELTFFSESGEHLTFQQPINVKMGPALLEYTPIYFGFDAIVGKSLELKGYNLFEKHVTLELLDQSGKNVKLPNVAFVKDGRSFKVQIPGQLEAGQYILKVFQDDVVTDPCYRLNIFKDENKEPYIGTIGEDKMPCSLVTPVIVVKETKTFLTYYQDISGTARLRLTNTATGGNYYGLITPYAVGGIPPSLIVPNEVPDDMYIASLEILDVTGKVLFETAPYARPLKVSKE
jgi:hypothetical protein